MSSRNQKKHSKEFKFKVAIEAIKEQKTQTTLCREFDIHDSQVQRWKKKLKEQGPAIFADANAVNGNNKIAELEAQIKKLNEYIGELSVENKFFKKNLNF